MTIHALPLQFYFVHIIEFYLHHAHLDLLKVLTIGDLLLKLENAGEVGVEIAEHQATKGDAGESILAPKTPVVFVLDPIKAEKKKKKKALSIGFLKLCQFRWHLSFSSWQCVQLS